MFFRNLIRYGDYMIASARANLKADVAGSYLNWLWWVLEPLGLMAIYAILFGWLFKNGIAYFPIFIFAGNAIWGYFNKVTTASTTLIKSNEMLVSKIYLPKYILLIVEMLIEGFKLLIEFGLTAILMIIFRVPLSANIIWIFPVLAVLIVNIFGFGMIMMNFGVFIDDLSHAMSIIMTVWMYFSGIFYDIETMIPQPVSKWILAFNGPAFFIDSFRGALIFNEQPNLIRLVVWGIVGLILSVLGIYIVNKNENNYVKRM